MRILSLDVALGGAVLSNSIAYAYGHTLPVGVTTSLICAIWLIYSLDHLIDANKNLIEPSMERHKFHRRYKRAIVAGMILVAAIGALSLLLVPPITLIFGLLITFIVFIYFVLSWRLKIFLIKEVLIASVYGTGVLIGPVSLIQIPIDQFLFLIIQIFGLALINLLILSYYEVEFDTMDGQHSWAVKFGKEVTQRHIQISIYALLGFQAISIYIMREYPELQFLLICMTLIMWVVFQQKGFFKEDERYRSFSDLVFFLPGLIFWF